LTEQLLKRLFNATPIPLSVGYTNETFLLEGTEPKMVAKVVNSFNEDIHNEIHSLKILDGTGISPKILDVVETDAIQIILMDYREGLNGQSLLDNKEIERTKELYKYMGDTLAKVIHSRKYNNDPKGVRECDLQKLDLKLDFVPDDLIQQSKEILFSIDDQKSNWVLTHGDFGIHNVLFPENNKITVLDWEWAEWANPLTDIGWVCWFTRLHYPEYADELLPLFMETYNITHFSPEEMKAYCVYKVWKVLYRVQKAPLEAQKEWVRRLKWTLETELWK